MSIQLTDLQNLMHEPSGAARVAVAEKVASSFAEGGFTENERRIAVEIFRLLVNDAEIMVRKMLSNHLSHSLDVPHDVIFTLATDVNEVALKVLEYSYVLTEDDLIAITQSTQDPTVMSAVARREMISRELSEELLRKSNLTVIETLLKNRGANIQENAFQQLFSTYRGNKSILELMVKRGGLPITLAERLFVAVSDDMKRILTQQYKLSMQMADESVTDAREQMTLGLVGSETRTMDVARLIEQLHHEGRLTLSIILRSLCLGDTRFFEHALAKLADVPIANAQLLLLDQSDRGFASLYKTSCLPMELFHATSYLFRAALEENHFGRYQRNDFKKRLVDRLMQDDAARKIEYMDYILTLIQHSPRDAPNTA